MHGAGDASVSRPPRRTARRQDRRTRSTEEKPAKPARPRPTATLRTSARQGGAGGDMPLGSRAMKLREEEVRVPAPDGEIRAVVISSGRRRARRPGVLLYTDIFQLTESTLRTARRLASSGFVVCVPEIYPHGELAGVALEFDDAGKQAGQAGAAAHDDRRSSTPTGSRCWTTSAPAPTSTGCARSASASAATWRSGRRSTRGSRRRCASTRPGCTTVRWAPTPTRARWRRGRASAADS